MFPIERNDEHWIPNVFLDIKSDKESINDEGPRNKNWNKYDIKSIWFILSPDFVNQTQLMQFMNLTFASIMSIVKFNLNYKRNVDTFLQHTILQEF